MIKKAWLILILLAAASCATFQKTYTPPSFYLEPPRPVMLASLNLNQRLIFEDGWKSIKKGDVDGARKNFLKLGANSPFYHLGEGYCRLYENDLQAAESFFQKALEIDRELIPARIGLVTIYEHLGQEEKEFSQLREILKKEPDHAWARPKLEALKNKLTQQLVSQAREALGKNKKEEARQNLLKALFYAPDSVETHTLLARIYRSEKKLPQALNHYQAALNLSANDKVLLREYAETLLENDDLSKSLDIYEKLEELNPQDKEVLGKISFLRNQLGIVEIPSLYNQIPQSSAITRQDLAAIIGVKFYQFLPEPKNTPIIVDIAASWASKFIIKVVGNSIMDVYENHTFEANRTITKAELSETFYRLINHLKSRGKKIIPQIPENKIMISDIPTDNLYYYPAVQMVAYQLMELSPSRRFMPEAPVPGNEALRIADLLLNLIQ